MAGTAPPGQAETVLPDARTVLVTGANGFVGTRLCVALEAAGKTVVRVSRRSGFDVARDSLPLDGVGHVFHAAARTGVPASWGEPTAFLDVNTLGTARVLEQCRASGCGLTFLSAYVYGVPRRLPIRESDPVEPNNPYALSKHLAEQACAFYARNYGVRVASLRLFNLYGPGQAGNFLIPFIVEQALDPRCATIEVQDLHPRRDYIHVDDAVEAILRATRAPAGAVFNVGSGVAYSVEEVIRRVCSLADVEKPYCGKAARRPNEIDATEADVSALNAAVGWSPRVSLDEGLRGLIEDRRPR